MIRPVTPCPRTANLVLNKRDRKGTRHNGAVKARSGLGVKVGKQEDDLQRGLQGSVIVILRGPDPRVLNNPTPDSSWAGLQFKVTHVLWEKDDRIRGAFINLEMRKTALRWPTDQTKEVSAKSNSLHALVKRWEMVRTS